MWVVHTLATTSLRGTFAASRSRPARASRSSDGYNAFISYSHAADGHWDAINAFLDENVTAEPGPTQDAALALDSFSQAAMEARFELERRDGG